MRSGKGQWPDAAGLKDAVRAARGEIAADLVIKGAQFLDVFAGRFVAGDVAVYKGRIIGTGESYAGETEVDGTGLWLVPGFIDAHVHIESSMMTPARFQEAVLPCGTTTVIWDPHEIANVAGREGIEWALRASEGLDIDVFVMMPSCVPSTSPAAGLESSGATLFARDIRDWRSHPRVLGLAEMMNFPGLLHGDPDVLTKLDDWSSLKRDGHCPGLSGRDLNAYAAAGIHSCHESTTREEALEKLTKGIHVWIREGSCAKDAEALLPLLNPRSSAVLGMCSDDRNPLDIAHEGHIDCIINMALHRGLAPEDVFRAASFAPARAYGLEDRGAIAPGYVADFVLVEPRRTHGIKIQGVWKRGRRIVKEALASTAAARADHDRFVLKGRPANINMPPVTAEHLQLKSAAKAQQRVRVIGVRPGQIVTDHLTEDLRVESGLLQADPARDILKIAVFERHHGKGGSACAFVHGFGLKTGAIATSINHDSHNVIVVGANDELMLRATEELRKIDGGIVVVSGSGEVSRLSLPFGGLMTDQSPAQVASELVALKKLAASCGCTLEEPFLQLSFLALPVIPALKITDRGLVDVGAFRIVSVVE
jgi:adenine deaminase